MRLHRHKYVPVAVTPLRMSGGPWTTVLFRCSHCGEVKTSDLQGAWSVDDLAGTKHANPSTDA